MREVEIKHEMVVFPPSKLVKEGFLLITVVGFPLNGRFLAFPSKIRPGWKQEILANYDTKLIMAVKNCTVQVHREKLK